MGGDPLGEREGEGSVKAVERWNQCEIERWSSGNLGRWYPRWWRRCADCDYPEHISMF